MFEWDTEKAAHNLRKHDVPFELAQRVFDDPWRVEVDASREREGEVRRKMIGRVGDKLFAVVFTMRGEARRIISARRTNPKEDRQYADRS